MLSRLTMDQSKPSVVAPILTFLAVSTAAFPLLFTVQQPLRLDPDLLRLTVFSTAIGAAAVWLIWRGRLPYPTVTRKGIAAPICGAVIVSILFAGAMFGVARAQVAPWRPPNLHALPAPIGVFFVIQLVGALAEEVGWRGLIQPLIEIKAPAPIAAIVTGLLFGMGHFYIAFAIAPLACALFIVSATGLSVILAVFTTGRSAPVRILIATVLHFLINMVTFFLFTDGDGSVRYFADLAAVSGTFGAVGLIVLARGAGRAPAGNRA